MGALLVATAGWMNASEAVIAVSSSVKGSRTRPNTMLAKMITKIILEAI